MNAATPSVRAAAAEASRRRLLDAAVDVIRGQGLAATSVDDICCAAGLTKGAFFHHFRSKEECALAAAAHFSGRAETLFAAAPYRDLADPRARVLGYVEFRKAILRGALPQFTCLLGTMAQEAYETHPAIREACDRYIRLHADGVAADLEAAKALYAPDGDWSPPSVALFTQATLQGAFVLAKASHGPEIAVECLDHLRRYLEALLPDRAARPRRNGDAPKRKEAA